MKTINQLKEEIGLYKLLMTITSAISISLIGWIFNNYSASTEKLILVLAAMIIASYATAFLLIQINIKIEELSYE